MVHLVMFKVVCVQLHIEGGANKPTEAVLKTFNVGAVTKNKTVNFVDFRQIARGKIEAVLQVKIVTQAKVEVHSEGLPRIPGHSKNENPVDLLGYSKNENPAETKKIQSRKQDLSSLLAQ